LKENYRRRIGKLAIKLSPSVVNITKRWSKQSDLNGSRDILGDNTEPEAT